MKFGNRNNVPEPVPDPQPLPFYVMTLSAAVLISVTVYYLRKWLTSPAKQGKAMLEEELEAAEARVRALRQQLQMQMNTLPPHVSRKRAGKPLRIWMDGAFDMMHYGHVNAFRQGRSLGTHLVVGVNDDESIARCKGAPPVMNDAERLAMVKGCKFVDEVVPNVPYVMSDEYVRWVIKTYNIDFVVHGDDPCIVDGRDVYESAQRLGKYMTIPRTEGVSTTEIVGRMLLLTSDHLLTSSPQSVSAPGAGSASPLLEPGCKGATLSQVMPPELDALPPSMVLKVDTKKPPPAADATPPMNASPAMNASFIRESKFLTTSRMLRLFASGCAAPPAGARVVYVDGGWDMFHAGHVDFLRRARALGDYLLVGVHNDVQVNRRRGKNFPIMNLNERTLSVLSCRHVSDVVIDPPWHLTKEMLAALDITVVAHGSTNDPNDDDGLDPYEVPKAMGIFHELPSTMDLTVESILSRLHANRARLEKKVAKKQQDEKEYYDNRYGFAPKDSQKPA